MLSVSLFFLVFVRFPMKRCGASIFLNRHAVDMLNEFLFYLGDFGKMCLSHPYTNVVFDLFDLRLTIFPNFNCWGRIRKSSNFDPIFGKTNGTSYMKARLVSPRCFIFKMLPQKTFALSSFYFISLCLQVSVFLNAKRRDRNLPPFTCKRK